LKLKEKIFGKKVYVKCKRSVTIAVTNLAFRLGQGLTTVSKLKMLLSRFIKVCHPNIYSTVETLQAEEVRTGAEYHCTLLGMNPSPQKIFFK
jgi:hypothetical protein